MSTSAGPRLLGPAEVRALAAELDLRPTKQRGQNFVIDPNTVRRIVREAEVGADDVVVEVGPGLGSLTLALLETGARVVAIEIDPVLAGRLPATIAERAPEQADRFDLVQADALRVTSVPGPAPTALVANLPYNVSVPVLLHLLALLAGVEDVVLPQERPGAQYNYHMFPVLVRDAEERAAIRDAMWNQFVDTSAIYCDVVRECREFGYRGGCPVAESVASRLITLPNYASLTDEDIEWVAETFRSCLRAYRHGNRQWEPLLIPDFEPAVSRGPVR